MAVIKFHFKMMKENTTEKEQRLALLKKVIEDQMPVNKLLGMEIIALNEGYAKVKVPFKNEFVGDFKRGLWHGGVLAGVADSAGGLVALSLAHPDEQVNTIDMRIDYLHGAKEEDIFAEGHLIKSGKRVIVTDVKLFQKGNDQPVAVARCAYSILRKR